MLSTFLTSIGSYFTKYFLVASFLPVLAFAAVNLITAAIFVEGVGARFVATFLRNSSAVEVAFLTTAVTISLLIAAYVLSALNNYLRGLLEGKWPESVRNLFSVRHRLAYDALQQRLDAARRTQVDIEQADFVEILRQARVEGDRLHRNTFDVTVNDAPIVRQIAELQQRSSETLIPYADLSDAVTRLATALKSNSASVADNERQKALGNAQQALVLIIQSTLERARGTHYRLYNELSSSYGPQEIAPTTMGNVANTAQAYAVRRYNCNLELFWNDLQRVVQTDAAAQTAVLECKAQLDFLVASCWLTTAYWIAWLLAAALWGYSVGLFVVLSLAGPLGSYFWYRVATEHYRTFVDVLTTTLNLFRMKLLTMLSLPLPPDVVDERMLWNSLHRIASFDDDPINLKYRHPEGRA
jgi:hypothetical protein